VLKSSSFPGPKATASSPSDRIDAAWSFPGARQKDSGVGLGIAALLALLVHASLSLINTSSSAVILSPDVAELETFIPIDEVLPAVAPSAETEKNTEDSSATPDAAVPEPAHERPSRTPVAAAKDAGDPGAPSPTPGPSSNELAAPIATSDFGASNFAMVSGQGKSLGSGGLGRPGRGNGARPTSTTVSARDLSRAAIPPNLKPLVQRNFPTAARLARVGGTVTVSALIQTDGNPTDVRVVSVNPGGRGFGETCSRTVHEGPNWKPKLNAHGTPVASREHYVCRFDPPEGLPANVEGPTSGAGANRVWSRPAGG
jgi:outer membrane biosynthesis protein TonB